MAHSTDIVGYIYRADLYCPRCIVRQVAIGADKYLGFGWVEDILESRAIELGIDRSDESSFDPDEFPIVVVRDMLTFGDAGYGDGEDHTDRCGNCGEVLGS